MDWFPLWNSLRIATIATGITFFLGIFAAHEISKRSRAAKGFWDVLLTIPMVLPPTVVGFFLLRLLGPHGLIGARVLEWFQVKITMTWYASIFASVIVTFPLMYRTARGAFESYDRRILDAARTLGLSERYIFWRILLPGCRKGVAAGAILAFARGLGEYGATSMVSGYTPGRTATISTTVYQLWREGNDALAYQWVFVNLAISFIVLMSVNFMERKKR
ncbi:MAG: molybdate ABC transporter permease subunit [Butyricicoccus sp.]|nr:molybdate ABC transporter permease subunit [Butyricicoccus pullicaecorum]MCI6720494.1 molybdate ABC transporter permease subunit [Clostridiales bacterium]MDY5971879.1 molybdate ABC transporter permease subunit [Butyricicoccus sp.]